MLMWVVVMCCCMAATSLTSCKTHKKSIISRENYEVRSRKGAEAAISGKDADSPDGMAEASELLKEAYTWMGTPYGYGRSEKGVASDCSGMVLEVYLASTGIKLPRNSAEQAAFCELLKPEDVREGDLAFFATGKDPSRISHVGIMVDDTHFIHASTAKGVVVSDITTPYYQRTFIMFGRVPGAVIQRNGRARHAGHR